MVFVGAGTPIDRGGSPGDPHPRFSVAPRELLIGIVVLGFGVFMTVAWLAHPDGHTWKRVAAGAAAVLVGGTVVVLSFGRACSACGHRLQTFSFRTTAGLMPGVEHALAGGDGAAVAHALRSALATRPSDGAARSCSLAYCDGCRGLLAIDVSGADDVRRRRVVRGASATAVVPAVEAAAASAGAAGA